jgi:hypothetical protein
VAIAVQEDRTWMREPLAIAVAQRSCVSHDVAQNASIHAATFRSAGARVVVFPELSLTGYELGYGKYEVRTVPTIRTAVQLAAKQMRLTGRPTGFMVWHGAHSWVMSGFKATVDPAVGDSFKVSAVYIEDVWYPRISTIWGASNPPDTLVPVSGLPIDYFPWKRPQAKYPGMDGLYVLIVPVN